MMMGKAQKEGRRVSGPAPLRVTRQIYTLTALCNSFPAPLDAFSIAFKPQRTLLVGRDGISVEEFLSQPVRHWASP